MRLHKCEKKTLTKDLLKSVLILFQILFCLGRSLLGRMIQICQIERTSPLQSPPQMMDMNIG